MKIGPEETWELVSFNVFLSYQKYGLKILWENVWNKGLSSIEMETKGEGLDYAVPRAPKLRGKKEERKWMITQVCNVAQVLFAARRTNGEHNGKYGYFAGIRNGNQTVAGYEADLLIS